MGDGTASGVIHQHQPGVIYYEGENLPYIPEKWLTMSVAQLEGLATQAKHNLELFKDPTFFGPRDDEIDNWENALYVVECAKTQAQRREGIVQKEISK